jgi:hypothetical protein
MSDVFKEYFEFMDGLYNEVRDLAIALRPHKQHPWHRDLACLYLSILELLRSECILIKSGATLGVPILLRSMLEAHVDLINLAKDRNYGNHLRADELKEKVKIHEEMETGRNQLASSVAEDSGSHDDLKKEKDELDKLKKDGYPPLSIKCKFEKAGPLLLDVYRSFYIPLCCASHNNRSVFQERHIRISQDGNNFEIIDFPAVDFKNLLFEIDVIIETTIGATEEIHRVLQSGQADKIKPLKQERDRLSVRCKQALDKA